MAKTPEIVDVAIGVGIISTQSDHIVHVDVVRSLVDDNLTVATRIVRDHNALGSSPYHKRVVVKIMTPEMLEEMLQRAWKRGYDSGIETATADWP